MSIVDSAKQAMQGLMMGTLQKVVPLAPDRWMPGGTPDPLIARKHGLIGKPVSRLDGALKVTGGAAFAAEHRFEGMVYAALAYSTIAHGRIATIDTQAAEAAPGVVLVMTHRNAPRMAKAPMFGTSPSAVGPHNLAIFQDDRVHWNGQPIACVLAETQQQADHAVTLLTVRYTAEPSTTDLATARANGVEQGLFMGQPLRNAIGDAEGVLAKAAHRVDQRYRTPRHNHNPIEPHAATLAWDGDRLVIHDASQMVTQQAQAMADVFGLKTEQVRLTSPYVGGGFGSKGLWDHQVIAAAAARLAGRPARSAYAVPNMLLSVEVTRMNMLANTFMRAPGEAVGTFALESAIDELAVDLGIDPVELRIRNEPDKDPTSGLPFSSRHIVQAWRDGAQRFGWDARAATPGTRTEGEWHIGLGCATGTYPYYRMPGAKARITLRRDGEDVVAKVEVAAAEMGMGTSTTTAIVAAERLGLSLDRIEVAYGDSAIPGAIMAGGSQQTAAIGAAVMAAHAELVATLLKLAGNDSPLAGLSADEVGSDAGGLAKLDDPTRRESYASILSRAQRDSVSVTKAGAMPFEFMHWSMHSHSALFCEVRVNSVTGEIRVSRFLGSFDCGRILNPRTAASQFRGGIIMGLGMALMEETQFDDRTGRIMNPSLAEYHIPVHLDVPEIDVIWTDIPDPHAPMGAHGIGEIGITGVAAAVANAVCNATGVRVRDLPITLDRLL